MARAIDVEDFVKALATRGNGLHLGLVLAKQRNDTLNFVCELMHRTVAIQKYNGVLYSAVNVPRRMHVSNNRQ
jgi:hypothetical protein